MSVGLTAGIGSGDENGHERPHWVFRRSIFLKHMPEAGIEPTTFALRVRAESTIYNS